MNDLSLDKELSVVENILDKAGLSQKERYVLIQRLLGKTFKVLSREFGVSCERIGQIERKGAHKLWCQSLLHPLLLKLQERFDDKYMRYRGARLYRWLSYCECVECILKK